MRSIVGIFIFSSVAVASAQFGIENAVGDPLQDGNTIRKPEFFTMDWEFGTSLTAKPVPISIEIDSMGQQEVSLLVDKNGGPVLYTSDISTPVCADGECQLMHIRPYWNLLGEYAGFDRYSKLPLTKHDHDEFLYADYMKLHFLLMDDNSILKRKKIDELVEKPKNPKTEGADAVAGATIEEVKESVVDGALYSCYTAWHLVHGAVRDEIKEHTLSLLNDDMVLHMLRSGDSDYQLFALKKIDENGYVENHERIAQIFEMGIPLVRTFIIKNLPDSFWDSEKLQEPFWESFSKVDINSRSSLLEHLSNAPTVVIESLSQQMSAMTKNQLKVYLEHLGTLEKLAPSLKNNLEAFSDSNNETYAYLVTTFLGDYE